MVTSRRSEGQRFSDEERRLDPLVPTLPTLNTYETTLLNCKSFYATLAVFCNWSAGSPGASATLLVDRPNTSSRLPG